MLQLDAKRPDALLGLDEGAPDVVVADDAELEGDVRFLREADGCRHAGIGDRHDDVDVGRRLAGELHAHLLADVIDGAPADDAVGAGEVDILEDAGARRAHGEWTVALDAVLGDDDDLAVFDLAQELGADHVEGTGLRGEDVGRTELADDERADADGVASADQHVVGEADEGIGAFDLAERLDEALDDAPLLRAREEVEDDLGVGGRLADGAGGNELLAQGQGVGEVAVVADREAARIDVGEQRLHVAHNRVPRMWSSGCGRWRCAPAGGR